MNDGADDGGAMAENNSLFVDSELRKPTEQWYAIRTIARHEKRVAVQLSQKGIATYLPVLTEVHSWSDRQKKLEVPLFPSYSFVRLDDSVESRIAVLRTNSVVNLVGAGYRGTPIPSKQIEDIRKILQNGNTACARYPFLRVGQRVRVLGGCLEGIEGILVEKNGDGNLVISIEPILQSLAIRIEGYQVEIISSPRAEAA